MLTFFYFLYIVGPKAFPTRHSCTSSYFLCFERAAILFYRCFSAYILLFGYWWWHAYIYTCSCLICLIFQLKTWFYYCFSIKGFISTFHFQNWFLNESSTALIVIYGFLNLTYYFENSNQGRFWFIFYLPIDHYLLIHSRKILTLSTLSTILSFGSILGTGFYRFLLV